MDSTEISVVIPCLNEIENADAIARAVADALAKAGVSRYEILFIDNGSTDGTVEAIKAMCAADPRIRLIVNNQNYGQMRSPTYAIYQTRGQAVVGICADFQDPPEMIGDFIARWRAGAKIVLGVRAAEKTSAVMGVFRAIGYGVFSLVGDFPVIPNATGFGLYDRQVVDLLKSWRDFEPFFRGMLVESGWPIETVPYVRPPRAGGRSKNNYARMIDFGVSGLAISARRILRAPLYLGMATFCLIPVLLAAAAAAGFLGGAPWGWLIGALAALAFGLIFFFLGLMGEQVRQIALMVRGAPMVVEKERVNFPE